VRSSAAIPYDRLTPGPRSLSRALALRLCFSGVGSVGWGLLAFSSIFVFAFDLPALVQDTLRPEGAPVAVPGHVTRVEPTSLSIDKEKVHRYHFTWSAGGTQHTGASYRTGRDGPGPGSSVEVRVDPGRPETAVIVGMRRTAPSRGILFLLVLPTAALVLAAAGVAIGLRRGRLLREGEPAKGRLVGRETTTVRVNKVPVIRYTFAFTTRRGERATASVSTHEPGAILDDKEEPLFYDPAHPERAVLLGALPGDPRVDAHGGFDAHGSALPVLLLPVLAALVFLIGIWASC
jgi:hypothetical protein